MTATWPLRATAAATAVNVGHLRRTARRWLVRAVDDADTVDDLVLAVSEALENAADHAFVTLDVPGTMTITAVDHQDRVEITIVDDGRWQAPPADAGSRGRGLALMDQLADSSAVRPTAEGTSVTLVHRHAA